MVNVNSQVTIIMCDPAETADPTGIAGIHGDLKTGKIRVKLAKQIKDTNKHTRLRKTGMYLSMYNKKIKPSFIGIEINNRGGEIKKKLESRYDIILKGVTTSSGLTIQTREKGHAMDKPYMVEWFSEQMEKHNILFPDSTTSDMDELINQIPQISAMITPGGSVTYKAMRGRHDDLFMALLLCCHIFLVYLVKWRQENQ